MESGMVLLFGLASLLGSFLLFSVQPMIGKMVLPIFGGTPAVWNTCLVFFQGTLLCGYVLAYGAGRSRSTGPSRLSGFYLLGLGGLIAAGLVLQPITFRAGEAGPTSVAASPALILLGALLVSAALPLIVVSATAPLLQCWFALSGHPRADDPYFLYAASNAGSLLALLAYPFVIEPNLGLSTQSQVWKAGFLILAVLVLALGVAAWRLSRSPRGVNGPRALDPETVVPRLAPATWLRWIVLVFIPSSWLMGVTAYLTTDLAPVPLMWTIPLALYLLSFIVAFAGRGARLIRAATLSLPYLILPLVLVMAAGFVHFFWIPLHLATFFAGALACHGALARMRPPARHLTLFYVIIALGGFVGGIWTGLLAPLIFDRVVEYPLALVLVSLAAPGFAAPAAGGPWRRLIADLVFAGVVFGIAVVLATNQVGLSDSTVGVLGVMIASGLGILSCTTAQRRPARFALVVAAVLAAGALAPGVSGQLVHIERNFFGVLRVTHDAGQNVNRLFHGSTLHGQQSLDPGLRREPSTYFTQSGPIGQVFGAMEMVLGKPGSRVAIVGLGAGTLATYARPGQRWSFYELDPAVERIAGNPRYFTYLRDCQAEAVDIILGDARHRLRDAPDGAYQLIVLDAFSSDALPVHLLSREAIRLYRTKLGARGLMLFNLSNRYLDLDPVIGRQAADAGMVCRVCHDLRVSADEKRAGKQPSIWAVLAASNADLGGLATDRRWQAPAPRPGSAVWTDDYSDLASYLLFTQGRRRGDRL